MDGTGGSAIHRMVIDNRRGFVEVEFSNGRVERGVDPSLTVTNSRVGLPDDFDRIEYRPSMRTLTLTLPSGEELMVELFHSDADLASRRTERTAVYLDQNKWVALAQAVHSPERLSVADRSAANELMQLVRDERVIVLLSSAHMLETGSTTGRWRKHMGPLMVSVSRGWILRDPLAIRHAEFVAMLARRSAIEVSQPPAITLDLNAFYSDHLLTGQPPALSFQSSGGPLSTMDLTRVLAAATSIYSVLLEDEAISSPLGDQATRAWARAQADAARDCVEFRGSRERRRAFTLTHFLRDMEHDITLAASAIHADNATMLDWLEHAEEDIADAPYLSRYREVTYRRLCNPQDPWEPNDLVDMVYLTCATAYADVVVAENKTAHFLRLVQRERDDGARVFSSLIEAVESLGT